jgi:cysteinyl-tRNA synthetase
VNLRLRDNLTRGLVPIEPIDGERIRMYSCGPTVYRFAHVGNLRTFMLADLIRRVVLYHGVDVLQVQNITDVGHLRADAAGREVDPMLVAAGVEGRPSAEIADAYEAAFHADAALVNILPAHAFPRATEHIDDMLALARQLVDLGHAYVTEIGNVYYSVASFPSYGALSGNTLDSLRAGHRTEGEVEADKRDAADFALWRASGPDSTRDLHWPSPWGDGFPGWHLECSAMALRHLGPTFDIHTGGEDNVFPHHEDEIAQSAPIVGGPPARAWVHGAHLLMSGRKMSKSAGNFQRITELVESGLDPLAFRYLCLTARYAKKLNLSDASLAGAAGGLASLRAELAALGPAPASGPWAAPAVLRAGASPARPVGLAAGLTGHGGAGEPSVRPGIDGSAPVPSAGSAPVPIAGSAPVPSAGSDPVLADRAGIPLAPLSEAGRALHDSFVEAIDADLDMPTALRIARETLRAPLPPDERRWLVLDFDFVLGLDLDRSVPSTGNAGSGWAGVGAALALSAAAQRLLADRTKARAAQDWAAADGLRDELHKLGIEPIDRADGTSDWRHIP